MRPVFPLTRCCAGAASRTALQAAPNAWVFAALLAGSGAALAQAPGGPAPAALAHATALAVELARRDAPPGARVEAEPGKSDPRLRLAPCLQVQAQELPGVRPWGATRVGLQCQSGPVRWRITVPVTVRVWAPARVALRALPAHQDLRQAPDLFTVGVVDWGAERSPPLSPEAPLNDRQLARPLAAGAALRQDDLRAQQWFVAGDTVRVLARGSGFAIAADAQALSAGIEGRPARLKSANGRIITAIPVGARRAEMAL
jgi:flagellar basal body P-ring formation protein FlgA